MSLMAAGRDVAAVRAAVRTLDEHGSATHAIKQDIASETCEWLRFALGPGRRLDPERAQIETVAYEVLAVLVRNLRNPSAAESLCGIDLDLSATMLDHVDFSGAYLTGGTVDFRNCSFGSGATFADAHFLGARVIFDGSVFSGSTQRAGGHFPNATFSGSSVSFRDVVFVDHTCRFDDVDFRSGRVSFERAYVPDATLSFSRCRFRGAIVTFIDSVFERGGAIFRDCPVTGGELRFDRAKLRATMTLERMTIDGGLVSFDNSEMSGFTSFAHLALLTGSLTARNMTITSGTIDCDHMVVDGGNLALDGTEASFGNIDMSGASFVRGTVSLHDVRAPFDGVIYLPWATYTRGRMQVRDDSFDASREHEFIVARARYRPDVVTDWGPLAP